MNENKNTTQQNKWDVPISMLTGEFTAVNAMQNRRKILKIFPSLLH